MPKEIYDIVGSKLRLNLHPGQSKAWDSKARFVFVIAGTQGGKTSFGPWWCNREIDLRGGGDFLAVTANYDLFKLKMLPTLLNVFEHILARGRYWTKDKIIELKNPETGKFEASRVDDPMWGRIILRSAVAVSGLESATARGAWLDECGQDDFRLDAYDAIMRRLALFRGRVLGTTTPYNLGWLKQQIFDRWTAGDKDYDVVQFDSTRNPSFPIEEFLDRQAKMPAWKFNMFYRGMLERPVGLIYSDFIDRFNDEGGHKYRPFPRVPEKWSVWIGVDPGAVHLAKVWVAYDPETKNFYVFRCSLEGDKSTPEHVREALDLAASNFEDISGWFIGTRSEGQQRKDWEAAGAKNVEPPPIFDVESGIDAVISLFKTNRLFISEECRELLAELGSYSREVDEFGEVTDVIRDKNRYHLLDALRYAVTGAMDNQSEWEMILA